MNPEPGTRRRTPNPEPRTARDYQRAFLQFLELNEQRSAHTVRAYESDLSQFLAFVAAQMGK
ncbi:MAG TPA: site-specific integrase, partial [Gemmatimonadaceae bacterium]